MTLKRWLVLSGVVVIAALVLALKAYFAGIATATVAAAMAAEGARRNRARRKAEGLRRAAERQEASDAQMDGRAEARAHRVGAIVRESPEPEGEPLRSGLLNSRR